jgi:2-C-methyl-D-erythritol 4-phosphate cytidylyltransferase
MQSNAPTIAVVFAGGKGTRLANQTQPKQFVEVGGKPIIAWTLQLFENSSAIDAIYVVSIDSHLDLMKGLIVKHGFSKVKQVASGGDYAMDSIFIGLNLALADNQPEDAVVLIHDGVRPIINAELINRIVTSVTTDGNAVTSRPAYETLASSKDQGATVSTVTERSEMYTLHAPQAFRLGPIHKAHLLGKQERIHDKVVDQAHLISILEKEKLDPTLSPLRLVEGLVGNIKITTTDDINYFEFLLQSGKYQELTQSSKNS